MLSSLFVMYRLVGSLGIIFSGGPGMEARGVGAATCGGCACSVVYSYNVILCILISLCFRIIIHRVVDSGHEVVFSSQFYLPIIF